jgi:hypothetical protein
VPLVILCRCTLPPPHINSCVPQNNITAHIATYKRPANLPGAPPIYGKYVLEDAFLIEPDATSYATIIPYVGQTMVMGNEIYNSTTMQVRKELFPSSFSQSPNELWKLNKRLLNRSTAAVSM